ncbi:glutathione S-transferase [Amylibacter ulvae]|uniref:Glutathione S-transferase n=1 Tax=Paramylibacter ulvae TaxID=1651968 RepID=A0ABQ3D6Y7_9RHOB|nr:glutathione S-transferase family protein [Amylibacter ulvae]GHA56032.1 glutathione S-transferase [Amylibacter ulvae]
MQLYYADASPYARKVRACAVVLGLSDKIEIIDVTGTPVNTGSMPVDVNPLGKVPCLVTDRDEVIYDSRVITAYLNASVNGTLYPEGQDKWSKLTLEATGEGMMDAALSMVYEKRVRPAEIVFDDWIEGQWTKIARALVEIEKRWVDDLSGSITAAQIALGCALGYLDFRLDDRNWRDGHKTLAAWYEEFSKTDAMALTAPQG